MTKVRHLRRHTPGPGPLAASPAGAGVSVRGSGVGVATFYLCLHCWMLDCTLVSESMQQLNDFLSQWLFNLTFKCRER